MKIFREKAGVISKEPVWVCIHGYYMYLGDNLPQLLWVMATQWNDDRNIVGW